MGGKETTMEKAFSTERFMLLAKSDFLISKGNYIKFALAEIGVFIAIAVLVSINAISAINELRQFDYLTDSDSIDLISVKQMTYTQIFFTIAVWVLCLGMTVLGSITFCNLSTKKQRIATFMIPASLIEKFILRVIIYVILGLIVLIVGFLIGTCIIELSFGGVHEWLKTVTDILNVDSFHVSGLMVANGILWSLFGTSLYVLGSSLWPRLSWVKTWIVLTVIQWIIAIFLIVSLFSGFNLEDFINMTIASKGFLWSMISILSIFIIVCWAITWWRFKNTQIIQRFMKK